MPISYHYATIRIIVFYFSFSRKHTSILKRNIQLWCNVKSWYILSHTTIRVCILLDIIYGFIQ